MPFYALPYHIGVWKGMAGHKKGNGYKLEEGQRKVSGQSWEVNEGFLEVSGRSRGCHWRSLRGYMLIVKGNGQE